VGREESDVKENPAKIRYWAALPVFVFFDLRPILIADSRLEMGAHAAVDKSAKVWRSARAAEVCFQ
jgi:hypothetical protein